MCYKYGRKVGSIHGVMFYSFPTVDALAVDGVCEELLKLKFGYRAKFIYRSACYIQSQPLGVQWLYKLRQASYEEAHQALQQLAGIGPKVADCICLMALDKLATIPVDTHIWQIALRNYGLKQQGFKTLTPTAYAAVRQKWQSLFGPLAGWAHVVRYYI
jgi:N-glycosylase/DNA lyase